MAACSTSKMLPKCRQKLAQKTKVAHHIDAFVAWDILHFRQTQNWFQSSQDVQENRETGKRAMQTHSGL